ncbi:Vacuolar protein sorting-associated protein 41-like protein [Larimichthys crocea]|uniref:Uncharacterized protein n=1 Tax=Larimichthys crocea TaxID=215358 RepID=A0ACD3QP61_LARCR|nr:Vacuolar protein sorting-associated protein 41-like protein [Larimichthys crocea]
MAEVEEQGSKLSEEFTDESEEEDSEEEPKLKYERLSNGVTEILQNDAASCMTVHDKFLALGTHFGKVFLLDIQGNVTQKFEISSVKINQISLDESGEHVGICSEDGKVQVFGLYTREGFHENFDCPIKVVALHPQFTRSNYKQFVTGGNKLLLYERNWLNRWKTSVLHEGEGSITNIQWRANLIAWANNVGVKIYDIGTKQRITNVLRDNVSLRPDMYPCSLCWKDNATLIVGWGTSIKICVVKERNPTEMRDLPSRYVEIVSAFETEFFISGLAPLADQLVTLYFVKENSDHMCRTRSFVHGHVSTSFQPLPESCEEISSDAADLFATSKTTKHSEGESLFYIISPKDIVVAKERDQDDHIDWLLEKKKYEEALMAAEISFKNIKRHDVQKIGMEYINHLVEKGDYDSAARKCQKVLGKNMELWENEVYRFKTIGQLKAISQYLPRGDLRLRPAIYEMILHEFLKTDYEGFATLIREWPGELYNNMAIVQAVTDHLERDPTNRTLLTTLAELISINCSSGTTTKARSTTRDRSGLYAEYDRPNLLPFLRDSTHCPLEKALEVCQQRNFVEETVFLLSRMGNCRRALQMIMEELADVDKAIEFAKEQDDAELWEDLISYSIDKPPFITGLLNNIGTHVDPILLIHRIKEGMEIPNLRDSLVKILQDYNLQILLREGCKKILVADSLSLLQKMHRTQMRGVRVDGGMPAPKRGPSSPDSHPKMRKLDEDGEALTSKTAPAANNRSLKTGNMLEKTAAPPRTKKKLEGGNKPAKSPPPKDSTKTISDPPVKKAKLLLATSASCGEAPSQKANSKASLKRTASTESEDELSSDGGKTDLFRERGDGDKARCIRKYSNRVKAKRKAEESSSSSSVPHDSSQGSPSTPTDPVQMDHNYGRFSDSSSQDERKESAQPVSEQERQEISVHATQAEETLVSITGDAKAAVEGKHEELQNQKHLDNKALASCREILDSADKSEAENTEKDVEESVVDKETLASSVETLYCSTGEANPGCEGTDSTPRSQTDVSNEIETKDSAESVSEEIKPDIKCESEGEEHKVEAASVSAGHSDVGIEVKAEEVPVGGPTEENLTTTTESVGNPETQTDLSFKIQVTFKEESKSEHLQDRVSHEVPDTITSSV